MFSSFKLSITSDFFGNETNQDIATKYKCDKESIRQKLYEIIYGKDYIDGTLLQELWFPKIKSNIFISHSHKDEKLAIQLAGWLWDNFGLKTFIDSSVWEYADDLIKKLDDDYSFISQDKNNTVYDYSICHCTCSHVYLMLTNALTKMMDETECLIFLNSENSLSHDEYMKKENTRSPWIYTELELAKMIKRRELDYYRTDEWVEHKFANESAYPDIRYEIDTGELIDINDKDLKYWAGSGSNEFPLTTLYKIKKKEMEKIGVLLG